MTVVSRFPLPLLAAVAFVALVTQNAPLRAADAPDDVKALQGKWKPKEANLGDNKIDAMVLDTITLEYAADKYTLTIGDKVEKGSYTLDPKKSPKAMDIFPTEGDNNGKTFLAVYKIEDDKLTICYSLTPTVRPDDFEPDSNTLLLVKWERAKEP